MTQHHTKSPGTQVKTAWEIYLAVCNHMSNAELIPKDKAHQFVTVEDYQKLEDENTLLKKQLEYATGFTVNMLMEHNVSGTFIKHYEEQYGENEWVNIAYVKELLDIIALPPHKPWAPSHGVLR